MSFVSVASECGLSGKVLEGLRTSKQRVSGAVLRAAHKAALVARPWLLIRLRAGRVVISALRVFWRSDARCGSRSWAGRLVIWPGGRTERRLER